MRRQRTAIGLSPLALISRLTGRFCPVVSGVLRGERGLDIFQRQLHLVAIKNPEKLPVRPNRDGRQREASMN